MNGAAIQKLNLPEYGFRFSERQGQACIYDEFRQRWAVLTPEEWVRQNFLKFLSGQKGFPRSLMAVEKKVDIHGLPQRFDLLVYNRKGEPLLVAEFKAPGVAIDQGVFDQVIRYNNTLLAPYIIASNGLSHFCCYIDFSAGNASYLPEIPDFKDVSGC